MGVLGPLGVAHDDTVNWVLDVIALILRCTVGRFFLCGCLSQVFIIVSDFIFGVSWVRSVSGTFIDATSYYLLFRSDVIGCSTVYLPSSNCSVLGSRIVDSKDKYPLLQPSTRSASKSAALTILKCGSLEQGL